MAERRSKYRTAPDPERTGWPPGIPHIIGNEGCERFSFYGMKSILFVYLVFLYAQEGLPEEAASDRATAVTHFFVMGVYALPMVGAILSDRLLGKYPTIIALSLVYCAGHAALAVFEGNLQGIYLGLALIAVGSGGIKPCVSAHVGDQFGPGNWHRLERVFQGFYFIINVGAFLSTVLIPIVKEVWGWSVAFAIPGVLMGIATLVFWMGRHRFVHVPPDPGGRLGLLDFVSGSLLFMTVGSLFFTAAGPWPVAAGVSLGCLAAGLALFAVRQRLQPDDGFLAVMGGWLGARLGRGRPVAERFDEEAVDGTFAVLRIVGLFVFVLFFWALFDQHATSWVRQAKLMERTLDLPWIGVVEVLPEQLPAANPVLVLMLVPFAAYVVYPGLERLGLHMTPLRRMTLGMGIAASSFVVVALLQMRLDAGQSVHVAWQLLAYVLITLAEVMVSITGLEFAYSQAPRRMKSTLMGFWMLTVALGNMVTGLAAMFGGLALVHFFWLFAGLMAAAAVLFGLVARFYRYRDRTQFAG